MATTHGSKKKTVVVSGGSKGLGLGICRKLLSEGYCVATFSRKSTPEIEALVREYQGLAYWEAVDVTDPSRLSVFMRNAKKECGPVGYLVNNAGVAPESLLTLMKAKDISRVMQVNLESAIALTQLCVKQMLVAGSGAIVNISSIVGTRGYKGIGVYSATKAALDGLTRSLSKELGPMGIRINSLAPGFMDTEMTHGMQEIQRSRIQRQTPLGRLAAVDDVSPVVSFLLSEAAGFITGQTITVDGGLTV